ncbi:MAG: PAAR domain-containing protein [Sandaracinaceae bacterium]
MPPNTRPTPPGVRRMPSPADGPAPSSAAEAPAAPSTVNTFQGDLEVAAGDTHMGQVMLGNRHAMPVTGFMPADVMGDLVNQHVDPFVQFPFDEDGSVNWTAYVFQVAGGILGLPSILEDALDHGLAVLLSPFAQAMELPAACLFDLHVGMPHAHSHPPSLVPPAPPVPLPSLGNIMLSGAVTVTVGGIPAARAGDIGMAVTCGSLMPAFLIVTGSSSVFIGGGRAARMGDLTIHCNPILAAILKFQSAAAVMGAVGGAIAVGSAAATGNAIGAAAAAIQAAADVARDAIKATVGADPGIPPAVMGAITFGIPNVLIGGLPVPPSDLVIPVLKDLMDAHSQRRRNQHHDDADSDPENPRRNRFGACEC